MSSGQRPGARRPPFIGNPLHRRINRTLWKVCGLAGIGFLVAIPISYPVAEILTRLVETHVQMFAVGATLGSLGIGMVIAQGFLLHERAHHSIYPTLEGMPNVRLRIVLFGVSLALFISTAFYPVENPGIPWNNPTISSATTITVVLAGTLSRYFMKIFHDVTGFSREYIERKIKLLMVTFPLMPLLSHFIVYSQVKTGEPFWRVIENVIITVIGAIGLLYGFMGEIPKNGWETSETPSTQQSDYWIVEWLRATGLRTVAIATLGWVGYILASGTRSGAEPSFGSEVHIFPLLLTLRGVLAVLGVILALITVSVLLNIILLGIHQVKTIFNSRLSD